MKAIRNGVLIAHSDDTVIVEGTHCFLASSLKREHVLASDHRSSCAWKDQARHCSRVNLRRHAASTHSP